MVVMEIVDVVAMEPSRWGPLWIGLTWSKEAIMLIFYLLLLFLLLLF